MAAAWLMWALAAVWLRGGCVVDVGAGGCGAAWLMWALGFWWGLGNEAAARERQREGIRGLLTIQHRPARPTFPRLPTHNATFPTPIATPQPHRYLQPPSLPHPPIANPHHHPTQNHRLVFSYEILTPAALNFFVSYADGAVESLWSIDQYFQFVLVLMLSTGLSFQVGGWVWVGGAFKTQLRLLFNSAWGFWPTPLNPHPTPPPPPPPTP